MADDFFNKLTIDEDVLAPPSDEHAGFDDGALLGDLLNEVRDPEPAVENPAAGKDSTSSFLISVVILTLLAGVAIYAVVIPDKTGQTAALTVAIAEAPAATAPHQDRQALEQPVIQPNKTAVVEPVTPAQHGNKPVSKTTTDEEFAASVVTVNNNLDAQHDSAGPPWALNLMLVADRNNAAEHLSKLKAAGYGAELLHVTVKGKEWYRIRIPGFASVREARLTAAEIATGNTYQDSWVGGQ